MSSQLKIKDYRRLSGERTYARAKIYVSGFSNGLPERDLSSLPMVFNLQGRDVFISTSTWMPRICTACFRRIGRA